MDRFCDMKFNTSMHRQRVVRVPSPRGNLGASHINDAASRLIAANPFDAETGSLLSLARADLVTVTRNVLISNQANDAIDA